MNIKVFTAFSGYDSQCLALQRLSKAYPDFSFDLVGWSEFDPDSKQPIDKQPAVIVHKALFPQWADNNYGDVSKIDWSQVPDFDLFTYSFPCQDISVAGLQRGFDEGSGTRSGMLWECEKCIKAKRPKYLLLENVKALTSKRNRPNFQKWLDLLSGYGYSNYWQVLNAKNYGVPQNRERVFVVSILGEEGWYRFPSPFPLALRLKDILEENVDEKYYLKDSGVAWRQKLSEKNKAKGNGFSFAPTNGEGVASTVTTLAGNRIDDNYVKEPQVLTTKRTEFGKQVRKAYESHEEYYQRKELQEYAPREDGVSNTLTSVQKDNMLVEPTPAHKLVYEENGKVYIKNNTKEGKLEIKDGAVFDASYPSSSTRRGRVQEGGNVSPTLTTNTEGNLRVAEIMCGALRGRPNEDGGNSQNLEINKTGCTNTLTSVQKDNLVVEGGCTCTRVEGMIEQGKIPEGVCYIDAYNQSVHMEATACLRSGNRGLDWVKVPRVKGSIPSPDIKSNVGFAHAEEKTAATICLNSKVDGKQPSVASIVYDSRGVAVAVTTGWITNVAEDSGIITKGFVKSGKHQQDFVQSQEGICRTIPAGTHGSTPHLLKTEVSNYRIRKLTERECFRLMGLDEESIDIIKSTGISKSKQYALAGNSIVVDVLYYIFKNLFIGGEENEQEVEDSTPLTRIGNIYGPDRGTGFAGNVWDKEGLCPTLTTMEGGNRQPLIIADDAKSEEGRIRVELPSSTSRQLMLEFVSALTNS